MTPKRGKIGDAVGWGKKEQPVAAPVPIAAPATESGIVEPKTPRRARGTGAVVALNLRMNPEAWRALKILSVEQPGRTMQDLLLEGLDMVFTHYGKEPVARKP